MMGTILANLMGVKRRNKPHIKLTTRELAKSNNRRHRVENDPKSPFFGWTDEEWEDYLDRLYGPARKTRRNRWASSYQDRVLSEVSKALEKAQA